MTSDTPLRDGVEQRLHPSSVAFSFLSHLKSWAVPLILALFFARGDRWELWLLILLIPSTLWELLRYFTTRYRFDPGELVVRDGLIFRNERHIPFERIQNLDLVQGPLQRWLGVAQVLVQTASGSEPEAQLKVLKLAAVDVMRRKIFEGRTGSAAVPEPAGPAPLVMLRAGDLVRLGLVMNRGDALILAGLGLAWELKVSEWLEVKRLSDWLSHFTPVVAIELFLVLATAFLLVTWLASIVWSLVRFHGFVLERHGEDFRIHCGLWTRHASTIPRRRIQRVSIHESLLQRWWGQVTVKVETGGGMGEDEEQRALGRQWFVPLLARSRLPQVLAEIDPHLDLTQVHWQAPAPGYRGRMARKHALLAAALAALLGGIFFPWGGLSIAALLPAALWWSHAQAGALRWARWPHGIAFQSGALRRKTSAASTSRIQAVVLLESPFDRRHRMRTLAVDTASSGTSRHQIVIPYLEADSSEALWKDLAAEAERTGEHWQRESARRTMEPRALVSAVATDNPEGAPSMARSPAEL